MKILLVEDDRLLAREIARALREENFAVDVAAERRGRTAHLGETESYDAPRCSISACRKCPASTSCAGWRKHDRHLPVLILTARDGWTDKVDGFKAGADDYIDEAVPDRGVGHARLRALVRRALPGHSAPRISCDARWSFETQTGVFEPGWTAVEVDRAGMAGSGMPCPPQGHRRRAHRCSRRRSTKATSGPIQFDRGDRRATAPQDRQSADRDREGSRLQAQLGLPLMSRTTSLSRRLMIGAGVFITVALVVAAVLISFVLHRFVQGQIDRGSTPRSCSCRRCSMPTEAAICVWRDPPTAHPSTAAGTAGTGKSPDRTTRCDHGRSMGPIWLLPISATGRRHLRPRRAGPTTTRRRGDRPAPADGIGSGRPQAPLPHPERIRIGSSGDDRGFRSADAVLGPLWEAMRTLALSLARARHRIDLRHADPGQTGTAPAGAIATRSGRCAIGAAASAYPTPSRAKVQPLATELNALLVQNAANLERARKHVSNLAHGLKTPLATLAIALQKQPSGSRDLHDLVVLMDRRIRHHLGRARSAALGGPVRSRTAVASRVTDLALVLGKVNADKPIAFVNRVPPELSVACEQQDIDEMLGNVLENAFSWCRGEVVVGSSEDGQERRHRRRRRRPGLSPEQMSQAMQAGRRLDESAPGFGFGLSITRELAELYGGSLTLDRSSLGGLRAAMRLPPLGWSDRLAFVSTVRDRRPRTPAGRCRRTRPIGRSLN